MPGGYRVMGDDGSMDYSIHEAWNEATNVYLVVILVSFGLFMYAKRYILCYLRVDKETGYLKVLQVCVCVLPELNAQK